MVRRLLVQQGSPYVNMRCASEQWETSRPATLKLVKRIWMNTNTIDRLRDRLNLRDTSTTGTAFWGYYLPCPSSLSTPGACMHHRLYDKLSAFSERQSHWLRKKSVFMLAYEKMTWYLIWFVDSAKFPREFMVTVPSFKSKQPDVQFVNRWQSRLWFRVWQRSDGQFAVVASNGWWHSGSVHYLLYSLLFSCARILCY